MEIVIKEAKAEVSFTDVELAKIDSKHPDLVISDIILKKLRNQGFPHNSLKEHVVITQWSDSGKTNWYAYATWVEKVKI